MQASVNELQPLASDPIKVARLGSRAAYTRPHPRFEATRQRRTGTVARRVDLDAYQARGA